jgi:hypothetical protein
MCLFPALLPLLHLAVQIVRKGPSKRFMFQFKRRKRGGGAASAASHRRRYKTFGETIIVG